MIDNVERELTDEELSEVNGGVHPHHWGHGFGFGNPFFGGFGSFNSGFAPQFVVAQPQPQVVLVEPTGTQTVQASGQTFELVSVG